MREAKLYKMLINMPMQTYGDGTLGVREGEHVYPERAGQAGTGDD